MKARFIGKAVSQAVVLVLLGSVLSQASADNKYIRDLGEKKAVTFEDGCRAIMMLRTGEIPTGTFVEVAEELGKADIIKEEWKTEPARILSKGRIAYMICKTLNIKGGLTMRLFGTSQRYALRALVDNRIMAKGEHAKYVVGGELLGIIFRAERYNYKVKQAKKVAHKHPAEETAGGKA